MTPSPDPLPATVTLTAVTLTAPTPAPALTVAAVVICFNQQRFLADCLAGLAAQTRPPDQVIIVDDCSGDGSQGHLQEWVAAHRPDATVILHATNQGVVRTLNEAFALVTCDLVAPLAADDVWLPDKLHRQVAQLQQLPERVGVLYGDVARIDEDGHLLAGSFIESYKGAAVHPEGDLFAELLHGNFLPSPSLLLRTACWHRVGRFDEGLHMEDWDFWLRVAQHYDFAFSPYAVGRYRVVSGSHVRTPGPAVYESHLATLLKWTHTPQLQTPWARSTIRGLACGLYGHGTRRHTRPRMAWLWVRYGGIPAWLADRLRRRR